MINIKNCNNKILLKEIPDKSIQLFLEDPPYNTTNCSFEYDIDLQEYWDLRLNKIKDDGCFCIFAQELFASKLRMSNMKMYKYDWFWKKERPTNIFQIKKRHGKNVENIVVFYKKQCIYNPQKFRHEGKLRSNKVKNGVLGKIIDENKNKVKEYKDDGFRYPLQTIEFKRDILKSNLHPTQKPLELIEYLIKT